MRRGRSRTAAPTTRLALVGTSRQCSSWLFGIAVDLTMAVRSSRSALQIVCRRLPPVPMLKYRLGATRQTESYQRGRSAPASGPLIRPG